MITEHWSGRVQFFWEGMLTPEKIRGYSVRVRDPRSGQWSIYWMDSRAPGFDAPYVGSFLRDRGKFFRMIETPDGPRRARIAFSTTRAEIVDWELAVSADKGVN